MLFALLLIAGGIPMAGGSKPASIMAAQQSPDATARFSRALELQRQGALKEAADQYRILLDQNPNYIEALGNLGTVLSRLGQYEESVEVYERALKLAPDLTPILLNLGIAHHRAGQFEKAAEAFERVLSKQPDAIQARQLLGISLVEVGRDLEAVAHLEQSLAASPDDPAVLYSLGLAYLRLGRSELSGIIARLEQTAAGIAAAHLLRGQKLLGAYEFEASLIELEAAAKLDSRLPRLQYSMGLALLKVGQYDRAIVAFEAELGVTPRDFSTLYYLAYAHEAEGGLDAGYGRIQQALKLAPESPEANALAGKILMKQERPQAALVYLERAVNSDPGDPNNRYVLARVYQRIGRREDADREFAEVRRIKGDQFKGDQARTPRP
jgi:tetratricopeptide (TPR) repeat protein